MGGQDSLHYTFFGIRRYDLLSPQALSSGEHTVVVDFIPETERPGGPAKVTMSIDGEEVGTLDLPEQIPMRCGTESMDVGMDCVSPVCDDYEDEGTFPFTGKIEHITLDLPAVKQPIGHERLEMATRMD